MDRRAYLAGVLGGTVGALSGCAGPVDTVRSAGSGGAEGTPVDPSSVTGADGTPPGICSRDPRPRRIPAIVDPAFAPSWRAGGVESTLQDQAAVIGIARDDAARAYPIQVLRRYEIVNDAFDVPVLVTYCPLCSSGMTAIRRVGGEETVFGNTSYTWRPPGRVGDAAIDDDRVFGFSQQADPSAVEARNNVNMVLFDARTGSYWSQLLAQGICGEATGERLTLVPSEVASWVEWRSAHPDTEVLLPPPHSTTMAS